LGQEYFINSQELEDKIRSLLPSQGGAGAGFDLSASTQIIPVIDLTESAAGSNLRQDLQIAHSHSTATTFDVSNATTTIISNTGYFRVTGTVFMSYFGNTSIQRLRFNLNDGATDKDIYDIQPIGFGTANLMQITPLDFNVFIPAGGSANIIATQYARFSGSTRQIADITGELTNP